MSTTTVIIGAGIVGLHIANTLSEKGHEVYVLDMAPYLGEHTSGRNSGVIHAGVYYKTGSIKEELCIEGNRLTYEWLQRLNVTHIPCGKWIIAEPGQEDDFEPFYERIVKLPIPKPEIKTVNEVSLLEPGLRKTRAILVPSTGVLDAAAYIKSLSVYVENRGVTVLLNCKVTGIKDQQLETTRGEIPYDLVINSAGLFADEIAQMAGLTDYQIKPCRGDYYCVSRQPLKRPVYHLPYKDAKGLGVHVTPTTDGQTLLGPNAFFIENKTDYQHRTAVKDYEEALRFYAPNFVPKNLTPGSSGNRPKLFKNGSPLSEFIFEKNKNWIHLLGIESPGLTASPAIARSVLKML